LILFEHFAPLLKVQIAPVRRVVAHATLMGLPVPALASAVSWFDEIRQARGTADLIQGMRISLAPIPSSGSTGRRASTGRGTTYRAFAPWGCIGCFRWKYF
jgi:hypothetical protein